MGMEYDDSHKGCSLWGECLDCCAPAGQPCEDWCRSGSVCTCPPKT